MSVLLRDEESDALHKINNYIYKDTESLELFTVCFWAGYEGNRCTFAHDSGSSAVTVETELQSGPFTHELRLFYLYF